MFVTVPKQKHTIKVKPQGVLMGAPEQAGRLVGKKNTTTLGAIMWPRMVRAYSAFIGTTLIFISAVTL